MEQSVDPLLSLPTWAVVGLSAAPTVHGEQGCASLADIPFPLDVVDCFVAADYQRLSG